MLKPREEVHVDTIGPWEASVNLMHLSGNIKEEAMLTLTIIDKNTGLPKFLPSKIRLLGIQPFL